MSEFNSQSPHGGTGAVQIAQRHGVRAMFTLSGAHVFPLYDGAVMAEPPLPLYDVRHEQSAVFAAEATAKLTRTPGLAVLTAGPGITNGVSAVTTAFFNGSPVVVIGGRAPSFRWGTGSLQELDHPPLLAPVTKWAATIPSTERIVPEVDAAFTLATTPHRGPVFLDVAMDHLFGAITPGPDSGTPAPPPPERTPNPDLLDAAASLIAQAHHPVVVLGSDIWNDGAEVAAAELIQATGLPVITNGMARGVIAPEATQLINRARGVALAEADLVLVAGTPLDFRLGYGQFGRGGKAQVIHLQDSPSGLATHRELAVGLGADLAASLRGLTTRLLASGLHREVADWTSALAQAQRQALAKDEKLLTASASPIHPGRIYGELRQVLAPDAVVIGDGGDFVSFAGRLLPSAQPGCWLDPGPYGCLGTGLGYTMAARLARPQAQVVTLLGDGAAGLSLMDVDSLVRHNLPALLVVGNNAGWGLEKGPMNLIYGYDVVADLTPQTRYDLVVKALGGDGELVTEANQLGAALRRGLASPVPYCVNVITDPKISYPRQTTGV